MFFVLVSCGSYCGTLEAHGWVILSVLFGAFLKSWRFDGWRTNYCKPSHQPPLSRSINAPLYSNYHPLFGSYYQNQVTYGFLIELTCESLDHFIQRYLAIVWLCAFCFGKIRPKSQVIRTSVSNREVWSGKSWKCILKTKKGQLLKLEDVLHGFFTGANRKLFV